MDGASIFGLPLLSGDDTARLRAHARRLAASLGISWQEQAINFLEAEGDLSSRWALSPVIRTEFEYLVALHEIGHHALALRTFGDDGRTVLFENEVAVWKWVWENSLIDVSAEGWRACVNCLQTYELQPPPLQCVTALKDLAPQLEQFAWRGILTP